MKSPTRQDSQTTGRVDYRRARRQNQNDANWQSMAKIQNFRVPWEPLRKSEGDEAQSAGPACTPAESREQALLQSPIAAFELVCEEIRKRHETKTAILQEALQRTEPSRQFWVH